jgi:hypothetical protein
MTTAWDSSISSKAKALMNLPAGTFTVNELKYLLEIDISYYWNEYHKAMIGGLFDKYIAKCEASSTGQGG